MLSTIYLMLRDTYYHGRFEYPKGSGSWYDVNHESIITKELFEIVQEKLTVVPKTRPGTKEFDFTRLIQCGACESGITAEERFKKISNGTIRRYVYYHCSKGKRLPCNEPYIREEALLEQLLQLMDDIDIDEMCIHEKLAKELERYQKFAAGVLNMSAVTTSAPTVDIRSYAKYVLKEGSRDEKRDVLSCLKTHLVLQDQKIFLAQGAKVCA